MMFVAGNGHMRSEGRGIGTTDWLKRWGLVGSDEITQAVDLFSDSGGIPEQAHLDPKDGFARVIQEKDRNVGVDYLSGICLILR